MRSDPSRYWGVDGDRSGEGLGHPVDLGDGEVDPQLRQVGAVVAAGVEVDAEVAAPHDVGHEPVGQLGGERARREPGNDRFRSCRSGGSGSR